MKNAQVKEAHIEMMFIIPSVEEGYGIEDLWDTKSVNVFTAAFAEDQGFEMGEAYEINLRVTEEVRLLARALCRGISRGETEVTYEFILLEVKDVLGVAH